MSRRGMLDFMNCCCGLSTADAPYMPQTALAATPAAHILDLECIALPLVELCEGEGHGAAA